MSVSVIASGVNTIRPLGEEHLRMFRRMTSSASEVTPKITIPEEANDPTYKLHHHYRSYKAGLKDYYEWPECYGAAQEAVQKLSCMPSDVEKFYKTIETSEQDLTFSYFLSALVNKIIGENDTVTLDLKVEIGYLGLLFEKGNMVIKGAAGFDICGHMKGGKITIEGKVGGSIGWNSSGGKIYINGEDAPDISPDCRAEVYHKGVKVWPK